MRSTPSLSISNSKSYKKVFLKIAIFSAIFFVVNYWIGLKLENVADKKDIYATVKWEEFYETSHNTIDLVFLGSSYSYRSFDPEVFDNELNTNSFNMGSPLQKPVESYYVLKETVKYQKPSLVVFDMNWGVFNKDKYFNTKLWNYDSMKFSANKLGYLLNVFDQEQYFNALFKSMRYHDDMDKLIKSLLGINVSIKSEKDVQTYLKNYKGKGFIVNNDLVDVNSIEKKFENAKKNPKTYKWDKRQLKYLDKIVKLCEKENIELVLVTAPLAPTYLEKYNAHWYDYDEIHEAANEIAENYGLKYFDYNLINKVENIVTDTDFADTNHLNYDGAQKISFHLVQLIKNEIKVSYKE